MFLMTLHCTQPSLQEISYLKEMGHYARMSYQPLPSKETFGNGAGFVYQKGDDLIVSLRGTASMQDWLADLNFFPHSPQFLRLEENGIAKFNLHSGFYQHVQKFQSELEEIIQRYNANNPNLRLHFVGHSMGGATAQICALLTTLRFPDMAITVTDFGSPKVFDEIGNQIFSSFPNIQHNIVIIRDSQGQDVIPLLPPSMLSCLREGNGKLYTLAFGGVRTSLPLMGFFGLDIPQYHKIDQYWDALRALTDITTP